MIKQKKYLNSGAEEFVNSLRTGTRPKEKSEQIFFNKLHKDSKKYLDGEINDFDNLKYNGKDPSEKFLRSYYKNAKNRRIKVAILSIDIVGSTKLSNHLNKITYAKLISLFLRSMAQIIYNHNGFSLKYVGDETIAYFPSPDLEGMNDNALFCAYAMKKYIQRILNPLLLERQLPKINFRISLNSGEAMIVVAGHPVSMQHFDLIGEPINLTKKIQIPSERNTILVGENIANFAHDFWKTKTKEVKNKNNTGIKINRLGILV